MSIRRLLKQPLALVFKKIGCFRNFLFDKQILRSRSLSVPVVCIGNSTMGGTGKTPFVLWLLGEMQTRKVSAGVISRGYKGSYQGVVEVPRAGNPKKFGDEPSMIKRRFGDVPVFLSRRRYEAGLELLDKYQVNLILADDSFQHRWLNSSLNILLIDLSRSLNHLEVFPLGMGREPVHSALKRADIVCVTKINLVTLKERESRLKYIKDLVPVSCLVAVAEYRIVSIHSLDGSEIDRASLGRYQTFSAIANPEGFHRALLEFIGHSSAMNHMLSDHQPISEKDAEVLLAQLSHDEKLILTEKDEVKWSISDPRVCVARAEMVFVEGKNEVLDEVFKLCR